VIIRLLFILAQIPSFTRRLNILKLIILKLIVILFEKKLHLDISGPSLFVNSNDQLADTFTKSLRKPRIDYIFGTYNLYAPA